MHLGTFFCLYECRVMRIHNIHGIFVVINNNEPNGFVENAIIYSKTRDSLLDTTIWINKANRVAGIWYIREQTRIRPQMSTE